MSARSPQTTTRLRAAAALAAVVPLGFAAKFYPGPLAGWVNNSLGGTFYEVFWCLVAVALFPSVRPAVAGVAVLLATCSLEFLQLWHPPLLEALRSSFIGVTILGRQFAWSDFPYYFVDAATGWAMLTRLQARAPQATNRAEIPE